ncbi:MAG TPA: rod shape-determining protein MreD [Allosphingosinicella sp.]
MSRIAYSQRDVRMRQARRRYVPVASILIAILLSSLPIVVSTPLIPDIAFLMLVAWRLLRPEIWNAYAALPLGLIDDLAGGQPIGQSMALWTITFLTLDIVDSRLHWRDYWMEWFLAALAIFGYIFGGWVIARAMGSGAAFTVLLPQLAFSVFFYPLVARFVLALDRWRLAR